MPNGLVISVRLYDNRYNGAGEWPPAPARLFQALIAAAGISGPLESEDCDALAWLENLPEPPVIAAPRKRDGHKVTVYVPSNDLDTVGGDPQRIAAIRGGTKVWKARLLQDATPFKYLWTFHPDDLSMRRARSICALAERLYQFGRGVDFACAWGETLDEGQIVTELSGYPGPVHRPAQSEKHGLLLKCPVRGSLQSIKDRYLSFGTRFYTETHGKIKTLVYAKSPVTRFATISYDNPIQRILFDLRRPPDAEVGFLAWPLAQAAGLVELIRDRAAERLKAVLPARTYDIERLLIGRSAEGVENIATYDRVKILPLPSIGHQHADRAIRRLLIEVPPGCTLSIGDVQWAISGLELSLPGDADAGGTVTIASEALERKILSYYGIGLSQEHCVWRTVTPMVLPRSGMRRRIEPTRRVEEAKGGLERMREYENATFAIAQALRHAGISAKPSSVRLQREPFEANGSRVELFARSTRFSKHRLWHVQMEFTTGLTGPLVIGDGRFLGLGLMAPIRDQ